MYRMLIVEDEKWEREGLRDFLDWHRLGIEVAGCACNGVEGLELAESLRPEIILTDVMMPKMDGIQMSRQIRTFLPDTKIVVLSGYDDFQYARQSIGFQAYAYLLKPVAKTALEEVISRIPVCLDRDRLNIMEREALEGWRSDYVAANKERLLFNFLEAQQKTEAVDELAASFGLDGPGKKNAAILSFCQDTKRMNAVEELSGNIIREYENEVRAFFNGAGVACSFSKSRKEVYLCLNAPASRPELEMRLRQWMDGIKRELGLEGMIGVGEPVETFAELAQSFQQAKEANSFRFLSDYGEVLFFSKLMEGGRNHRGHAKLLLLETSNIARRLADGIQKGNLPECRQGMEDFLAILRQNRGWAKLLWNSFFTELLSRLSPMGAKAADGVHPEFVPAGKWVGPDFSEMDSLSHTRRLLEGFLQVIPPQADRKKAIKEEEIVKEVLALIKENYAADLDLDGISETIHLSAYYIGSMFKRQTGKGFSQYLNEYRVDRATELLQGKKMKIGKLAELVGIRNPSYFCVLFKSRFGISPAEYAEREKGWEERV